MIAKAIDKILGLAEPHTLTIHGEEYADKPLTRIPQELRAEPITVHTLTALVDYIRKMQEDKEVMYLVHVVSPTEVQMISALDGDRKRETLIRAVARVPEIPFERFMDSEKMVITMQAMFENDPATDRAAVLQFCGTVKNESVTEYGDDGVSQKATIKYGVASVKEALVPSPCRLRPFRTFHEVEQPASDFIFRMRNEASSGVSAALFQADGGAWMNDAAQNIREFLEKSLEGVSGIIIIS